jgi:hypothetical protein
MEARREKEREGGEEKERERERLSGSLLFPFLFFIAPKPPAYGRVPSIFRSRSFPLS